MAMAWVIRYREETGSTNEDAAVLGRDGAPSGTVVWTGKQNRGRGRMERSWFSPAGKGLYFSVLLRPEIALREAGLLSFCAANAVAEALRSFGAEAGVKWPNDVVIGGRKVCGILSSCEGNGEALRFAVIGCGINLLHGSYPEELKERAVCLEEFGLTPDREEVLSRCLTAMEREVADLQKHGFSGVRDRFAGRCVLLGKPVIVSGGQNTGGVAEGVGDQGELLIRREDGTAEAVVCGDVSVRGVAGYV